MRRRLAALLSLLAASPLAAQGPGFQLGHLFTDPHATTYRLGTSVRLTGPLGAGVHAVVVDGRRPMGNLWGLGADLSFFRSGKAGAYAVGGVEGGVVTHGSETFWGSWSAGMGYELFPFPGLSLAAEARYRAVGRGGYDGVELGLRLGLDRGSRKQAPTSPAAGDVTGLSTPSPPPVDPTPEADAARADLGRSGVPADRATLIGDIVQTALDVMGMPYRWGDEGEQGFDCSGLIRYAFGKHGIAVPRSSAEQAREGEEITRDLDALRPGDVLTFATSGTRISHVGLYIGNGRFIHSARKGVQISVLSPDDVSGRWWFKRWRGARRLLS